MNLRTYLDKLPAGGRSALAASLKVSRVYLAQLASRQNDREPSPELCVRIETETNGKVTRRDLRTDWRAIWPELERRAEERS